MDDPPKNDIKDPSLLLEMKVYLGFYVRRDFVIFGHRFDIGFGFVWWDILHGDSQAAGIVCNTHL